jgi:diacylglycerol kinase family enzyme
MAYTSSTAHVLEQEPRAPRAVIVIVNHAARAAGRAPWARVADELNGRGLLPTFLHPRSRGEAAWMARRAARHGVAGIVVAGGDGTINTVLNAVAGIDVPLAILPLGTANDLARELGISLCTADAARRAAAGSERRIDVVQVNGRAFCTVGGLGLPAACVLAVDRLRTRGAMIRRLLAGLGAGVYPLVAAATIVATHGRPRRLRIAYRDPAGTERTVETAAHGLFIANQRLLAAGLVLPTLSANADGVFELCVVGAASRGRLLGTLACLRLGRPAPPKVLAVYPATHARIECETEDIVIGDGDRLARGRRFDVRIRPRALRVLC